MVTLNAHLFIWPQYIVFYFDISLMTDEIEDLTRSVNICNFEVHQIKWRVFDRVKLV